MKDKGKYPQQMGLYKFIYSHISDPMYSHRSTYDFTRFHQSPSDDQSPSPRDVLTKAQCMGRGVGLWGPWQEMMGFVKG